MHRSISTLTATGLLVAALSGCSVSVDGTARPAVADSVSGPTGSGPDDRPLQVPDEDGDPGRRSPAPRTEEERHERVLDDARTLKPVLDDFWSDELRDRYGLDFDTPRLRHYVDDGNGRCGGEYPSGDDNAYYCGAIGNEHVAFDLDWLADNLLDDPRNALTFLVLAHEWGHAVQDTWVEDEPGVDRWTGPDKELNADCLAGVFWGSSLREGTVVGQSMDTRTIVDWLGQAGSGTWSDPGEHGTSEQRQQAFSDGVAHDVDHCRRIY